VPIVVTGFEPLDLVQGVYLCVRQLESGRAEVENQYERCVREPQAQLSRTYAFLGLPDHTLTEEQLRQPRNATRRQAPPLDARRRQTLQAAYAPDVRLLRGTTPELDLSLWPNFAQLD